MELIVALVVGLFVGAGLVFVLSRSGQNRSDAALASAQADLQELRSESSSAKESLARIEAQREAELKAAAEKLALLEDAKAKLQDSFKALSSEALSKNNESFLNLAKTTLEKYQEGAKGDLEKRQQAINKTVEPVGEALKVFNERVAKIEERRTETDASLQQQLKQLAESQVQLSRTTGSLVQALRAPQVRGQWGEMQLRRTVEMAGMINYCDFEEQASVETEEVSVFGPICLSACQMSAWWWWIRRCRWLRIWMPYNLKTLMCKKSACRPTHVMCAIISKGCRPKPTGTNSTMRRSLWCFLSPTKRFSAPLWSKTRSSSSWAC